MEKRTCKLCFRSFSNGRALGGHMRSHMATLQTHLPPPPPPPLQQPKTQMSRQLGDESHETESASSTSSSSSEEEEKELGYGLRENPKKSFRLVDPEFSFVIDAGSVVQDRESETESSRNPFRRRSKRKRKSGLEGQQQKQEPELKIPKSTKFIKAESLVEPEPVSSVSDTTPEEDVALCLMMLSRGVWVRNEEVYEEEEEEEEKSIEETDDDSNEFKSCPSRNRGKYQCGTCKKVFRSYQALGGHRASHKKIRGCTAPSSSFVAPNLITHEADYEPGRNAAAGTKAAVAIDRRIHECPVCFRVFGSGQALGGHKRSHVSVSVTTITSKATNSAKFVDNLIDLNLPAPVDDDDISQIELSAVSDAEFVDPIK